MIQRTSIFSVVLLSLLVCITPVAHATICAMDSAPGATLLYPYFEVDVGAQGCGLSGPKSWIYVRNVTAEPTLVFVTVWSDWAVPVLGFSIYLAGQDMQAINLQGLFCWGILPSTGLFFSNHGELSQPGVAFLNCNNTNVAGDAPAYLPGAITPDELEHLKMWLTGQQSALTGSCAGRNFADDVARGYITIDVVTNCTTNLPSESNYYSNGDLSFDNRLAGEIQITGPDDNSERFFEAIALEANPSLTGILGGPTFYGRYNSGIIGFEYADGREPLPTTYGGRWAQDLSGSSSLIVWREADATDEDVACGLTPNWWPLDTTGGNAFVQFDNEANPFVPQSLPGLPEPEWFSFPDATQRLDAIPPDGSDFDNGWNYLNLSNNISPAASSSAGQAAVILDRPANTAFNHGHLAASLANQCPATTVFLSPSPEDDPIWTKFLLADGFETGDTSRWGSSP